MENPIDPHSIANYIRSTRLRARMYPTRFHFILFAGKELMVE